MERFGKIINDFQPFSIFAKRPSQMIKRALSTPLYVIIITDDKVQPWNYNMVNDETYQNM